MAPPDSNPESLDISSFDDQSRRSFTAAAYSASLGAGLVRASLPGLLPMLSKLRAPTTDSGPQADPWPQNADKMTRPPATITPT